MADNSTLVLILAQFLAVVVVAAVFLGLMLWRVRQRYRRLLSVYASLKHQAGHEHDAHEQPHPDDGAAPVKSIDWPSLEADSLERYKKFSEKSLGDYAADDPFSARIASIRYHYLQAERQAEAQATEHGRWQLIEKALSKLVSDVVSSGKSLEAHDPDKVSLLRERMKTLQHVEQDNAELRGQNQRYGAEIKKLRQYYRRYRALMADAGGPKVAESAEAQARAKARNITAAHDEQRQVVDEMHDHINREPHKTVYKSRDGVHESVDELRTGVQDYDKSLAQLHESLHKHTELDKLTVIDSLRSNNHRQRNTIASLHHELSELRHSLDSESGDKKGQTDALERMLSECENCIATLESEVAYLQEALDNSATAPLAEPSAPPEPTNALAETLLAFSLAVVEKNSPDDVLMLVADTLVQLNLPYLAAVVFEGEAAFSGSANLDNPTLRQKLTDIADVQLQEHSAEGLFFARPCLQVFIPEQALADVELQELIRVLDVMHSLVMLQLEQHTALERLTEHHLEVVQLGQKIRAGVTNIDIQYAYQTEEVKRIAGNLVVEIKQLLLGLDTDEEMRDVFSNVINEAQQRFDLLHEAGSIIDNEFTRLSDSLDELEQQ
jgi:hypothetical protein